MDLPDGKDVQIWGDIGQPIRLNYGGAGFNTVPYYKVTGGTGGKCGQLGSGAKAGQISAKKDARC